MSSRKRPRPVAARWPLAHQTPPTPPTDDDMLTRARTGRCLRCGRRAIPGAVHCRTCSRADMATAAAADPGPLTPDAAWWTDPRYAWPHRLDVLRTADEQIAALIPVTYHSFPAETSL